jgi:mannonate dehydratase
MLMTHTMRWFGPADPVRLTDIRQCGATGVVTALHDVPNGTVWTREEIERRQASIRAAGLEWSVVESLPVDEGIKTGRGNWRALLDAYRASIVNLAACGIRVVTYNFMPLLDWTRTDLAYALPDGAIALRYEHTAVAAYDVHMLKRPDAERDYDAATLAAAEVRYRAMSDAERLRLERTIIAGLPGSEQHFDTAAFRDALASYDGIDAAQLRANHIAFLRYARRRRPRG